MAPYYYKIIGLVVSVADLDLTLILEISVSGGFGKDLKIYSQQCLGTKQLKIESKNH